MARDASLMAIGFVAVILLMGATVAYRTVVLSPIQLIELEVTILDRETGLPVPNAVITLDYVNWPFEPKGDIDYSMITGEDGRATRQITGQAGRFYAAVRHSNYILDESGPYDFSQSSSDPWHIFIPVGPDPSDRFASLTVKLEPKDQPPSGYEATFYIVDNKGYRIEFAEADFEGYTYMGTPSGRIIISEVDPGYKSIRFKSRPGLKSFDFTRSFEMPHHDQAYTVNVDTKTIEAGDPPDPPDPVSQIRSWVVITVVLVALFLSFAILFQGRGPELIKMARGR